MATNDFIGERWLAAIGYSKGIRYDYADLYEISDLGRARSLDRITGGPHGPNSRVFPGRMLKHWIRDDGYPAFTLSKDGSARNWGAHVLVLCTFVGLPEPGQEALHGPNGKLDTRLAELRWGTREENVGPDRLRDGQSNRGEKSGLAKLTWDQVVEIRTRVAAGERQSAVALCFGIHKQTVNNIVHYQSWRYPPEEW